MNLDRGVCAVAGTVVLLSVLLAATVSTWWLLLTVFVGLNLLQSSITGFCPAAIVLARLGVPSGCAFTAPSSEDTTEQSHRDSLTTTREASP